MLVFFGLATLGTVLIIAALATETWWALIPALLAHGIGFFVAMGPLTKALQSTDKPDPVTEAAQEAEETGAESPPDGGERKMAI